MYCRQSLYGVVQYLQISVLHQVVKKRSSVRLRLTVFPAGCYSTTFDAAFSG